MYIFQKINIILSKLNKEKPIIGDFGSIYKGETYNLHHMQEQI